MTWRRRHRHDFQFVTPPLIEQALSSGLPFVPTGIQAQSIERCACGAERPGETLVYHWYGAP